MEGRTERRKKKKLNREIGKIKSQSKLHIHKVRDINNKTK
jgi:hypothetical protein